MTTERKAALELTFKRPRLGVLQAHQRLQEVIEGRDVPSRLVDTLARFNGIAAALEEGGAPIDAETAMRIVDMIYWLIEKEFTPTAAATCV